MGFDVLVFAEQREGRFKKSVFESLRLAGDLASGGGKVGAVLVGSGSGSLTGELSATGRARDLSRRRSIPRQLQRRGLRAARRIGLSSGEAHVILFPATAMGRDLAPRVAARLGVPLIAEAMEIARASGEGLPARKSMYGGKVFADRGHGRRRALRRDRPSRRLRCPPRFCPGAWRDLGTHGEAEPLSLRAPVSSRSCNRSARLSICKRPK